MTTESTITLSGARPPPATDTADEVRRPSRAFDASVARPPSSEVAVMEDPSFPTRRTPHLRPVPIRVFEEIGGSPYEAPEGLAIFANPAQDLAPDTAALAEDEGFIDLIPGPTLDPEAVTPDTGPRIVRRARHWPEGHQAIVEAVIATTQNVDPTDLADYANRVRVEFERRTGVSMTATAWRSLMFKWLSPPLISTLTEETVTAARWLREGFGALRRTEANSLDPNASAPNTAWTVAEEQALLQAATTAASGTALLADMAQRGYTRTPAGFGVHLAAMMKAGAQAPTPEVRDRWRLMSSALRSKIVGKIDEAIRGASFDAPTRPVDLQEGPPGPGVPIVEPGTEAVEKAASTRSTRRTLIAAVMSLRESAIVTRDEAIGFLDHIASQ